MPIRELPKPAPAINKNLIESLEKHVAAASSGQLQAMAFVGIAECGGTVTQCVIGDSVTGTQTFQLMGGMDFLKVRMIENLIEEVD